MAGHIRAAGGRAGVPTRPALTHTGVKVGAGPTAPEALMSRTDAHRPIWVWLNDHPDLVRESHNHASGRCDLPAAPFTVDALNWRHCRCHVHLDWTVRVCACDLCSENIWRRATERSRRAAERALERAAACGADEAELEVLEGRARRGRREAG